jgi:hypothetical protein
MSKSVTIPTEFNPADLPDWAKNQPEVVERAARDLAFRCDVYDASQGRPGDAQVQEHLSHQGHKK